MAEERSVIVSPSIVPVRVAALEVARSKIGMQEDRDAEGHGLNTGEIVDWSCDGFTRQRGIFWCGFFACQCFRHVLRERGDVQLLAHWAKLASGDCDMLWRRLGGEGWTWLWGESGRLPEPGDLLFYIMLKKDTGERRHHQDGTPDMRHVALISEFLPPLVHDISGNHGDQVGPHKEPIKNIGLYGCARVPW